MAKFIKSANFVSEYFEDKRNQICFIGRSNAGKSSLINALVNQSIAKTSSVPGKTKLVNFFDFDNVILVDLPGYGYAKTSKTNSENIQTLIFEYINYSKKLIGVFQLCSIDVITNQDLEISKEMQSVCKKHNLEYYIVLTKLDKITISQEKNHINKVSKFLNIDVNNIVAVSSKMRINIKKLNAIITKINLGHR